MRKKTLLVGLIVKLIESVEVELLISNQLELLIPSESGLVWACRIQPV